MISERLGAWLVTLERLRADQKARQLSRASRVDAIARLMAHGADREGRPAGAVTKSAPKSGRSIETARSPAHRASLVAGAPAAAPRPRPLWEDLPRVKPDPTTIATTSAPSRHPLKAGAGPTPALKAAQLAAGHQPAVLKIVSYGSGKTRATAMGKYVQRDDVALETHDGQLLEDHEAVAVEMEEWSKTFDRRRPSDDMMTVTMRVDGLTDTPEGRQRLAAAVAAGFAGHRHASRIDVAKDGGLRASVVAAFAGKRTVRGKNGDETIRDRFLMADSRQRGPRDLSPLSRRLIAERAAQSVGASREAVSLALEAAAYGKNGATCHLAGLARGGAAQLDDGKRLATDAEAGALAKGWARQLESREPRDVMHMVLSAKAGADPQAVVNAARSFLHDAFADHKFAFGLHTDKLESTGHMHVHAIIAVRGETGQRLNPGPAALRSWRESYALHAQAQGLKIVATSAAERASMQSYGAKDKAIVEAAERPRSKREAADRAYARANTDLVENARRRIERARTNPIRIPETEPQRRAVNESLRAWRGVLAERPQNPIAGASVIRLGKAQACANVITEVSRASASFSQRAAMSDATGEQMRKDLRQLNQTLAGTAATLSGETRQRFMERTARAMETMALQTDLKAMQERGVTEISVEEFARMAARPPNA
jgi:type IV secretory pathway VirD2 relaxase